MADSRRRLLWVLKILEDSASFKEGITMDQIMNRLENKRQQTYDRKAIYKDIDAITEVTDICVDRKSGVKVYKVEKKSSFNAEEIEIISNAILTAKFISKPHTEELINKLQNVTDETMSRVVRVQDRIKAKNVDVIKNVQIIRDAIKKNRKVQFDYVKYDINKELFTEKQKCNVSPYEDVWYQDYYYMLGSFSEDKISHYRIDRMANIRVLADARKSIGEVLGYGRDFNVAEYMSKLVGMSSGNEDIVKIKFLNEHIGDVLDNLGEQVTILKEGPDHFVLRAKLIINKKFIRWVLSFGNGAVVLKPDSLREEISHTLQSQLKNISEMN